MILRLILDNLLKILILSIALGFLFATVVFWFILTWQIGYHALPVEAAKKFEAFASLSGAVVGLVGVIAAIFTFLTSAAHSRQSQRKQHTITILLETRLSNEYRETNDCRKAVFPEYQDILFSDWMAARNFEPFGQAQMNGDTAQARRRGSEALLTLLNHYEFLALGIEMEDLDEDLLKKSLRGIMCNLVDDARDVIAHMRANNELTYIHLDRLYARWRREGAVDINGNPNERPIAKIT